MFQGIVFQAKWHFLPLLVALTLIGCGGSDNDAPLTATTNVTNLNLVYGSSTSGSIPVTVNSANKRWTVSSSVAWVVVPTTAQQGSQSLNLAVKQGGLAPGSYPIILTVVNADDPNDRVNLSVQAAVSAPTLKVSSSQIQLGGADGRAFEAQDLSLQINTGNNSYPWTATLTTESGVTWFALDQNQGALSENATVIHLSADPTLVAAGTYKGSVRVDVNVSGQILSQVIPIVLARNSHRLLASASGVLLSKLAGEQAPVSEAPREHLNQSVLVKTSWEGHRVAWTAASDQTWLTVTDHGQSADRGQLTGTNLTLQADPAGLAPDQLHVANVTISSTDSSLDTAQETIRVGFWIGVANLKNYAIVEHENPTVIGSPSEPVVFAHSGHDTIVAYNIYTTAVTRTLTTPIASMRGFAISPDGSKLFVLDASNWSTVVIDAQTGAVLTTYTKDPSVPYQGDGSVGLQFAQPDGHPIIITPWSEVFSVETGERLSRPVTVESGAVSDWGNLRSFTTDFRYLYSMQADIEPTKLDRWELSFDTRNGNALRAHRLLVLESSSARGTDICVSTDGTLLYTTESPYNGVAFRDVSTFNVLGSFRTPNFGGYSPDYLAQSLRCVDGAVVTALGTDKLPDILALSQKGESFLSYGGGYLPGVSAKNRSLVVSGDLTRVIQVKNSVVSTPHESLWITSLPEFGSVSLPQRL